MDTLSVNRKNKINLGLKCERNYLKSRKIVMDDIYRKEDKVMKYGYIILNIREKLSKRYGLLKRQNALLQQNDAKVEKVSYAIFFNSEGLVVQGALPKGQLITGQVC